MSSELYAREALFYLINRAYEAEIHGKEVEREGVCHVIPTHTPAEENVGILRRFFEFAKADDDKEKREEELRAAAAKEEALRKSDAVLDGGLPAGGVENQMPVY